ncbi:MAG: DUF2970 domain-containing protein [Bryobacteraceae bacterium]
MIAGGKEVKRTGVLPVIKTVLFAAMGVRRKADHERETQAADPALIIATGVVAAALFVLTLAIVVRMVVH